MEIKIINMNGKVLKGKTMINSIKTMVVNGLMRNKG